MSDKHKICIVGLGYVGLPLAIEFAKKFSVIGFDINKTRIDELSKRIDHTKEADLDALNNVISASKNGIDGLQFTSDLQDVKKCTIYIVTVPTPIDAFKAP